MTNEQAFWTSRLIEDGLSAEQIVALYRYDQILEAPVVDIFGNAIAFRIQRAQEE